MTTDTNRGAPKSVDEYIARFEPGTRDVLRKLRQAIKASAPDAEEKISYQMPAFAHHGILVWFAAHRRHIGFYPTASAVEAFRKDLASFETSKGTIKFPLDKPLPIALIKRIVAYRLKQQLGRGRPGIPRSRS